MIVADPNYAPMYGELHAPDQNGSPRRGRAGRSQSPRVVSRRRIGRRRRSGRRNRSCAPDGSSCRRVGRREPGAVAAAAIGLSPRHGQLRRRCPRGSPAWRCRRSSPRRWRRCVARSRPDDARFTAMDARLQTRTPTMPIVARLRSVPGVGLDRRDDVSRLRRSARALRPRRPGQCRDRLGATRRQFGRAPASRPHHEGGPARAAQPADSSGVGLLAPSAAVGRCGRGWNASRRAAAAASRWSPWRADLSRILFALWRDDTTFDGDETGDGVSAVAATGEATSRRVSAFSVMIREDRHGDCAARRCE